MKDLYEKIYKDGLVVFKNENLNSHQLIKNKIINSVSCQSLEEFHLSYDSNTINELRLNAYREINAIEEWEKIYHSMADQTLSELFGPDLLIQRKLNLSIQMPGDITSVLGLHMDTLSGQSPFEIVMWVPFTCVNASNGMYYFDRETSKKMRLEMPQYEDKGLEYLREKYWDKRIELALGEDDVVIFSGTLFHGNVINETQTTRISINCRFKNLFSPAARNLSTAERDVGIFYKLYSTSPITRIGMEYSAMEDSFA